VIGSAGARPSGGAATVRDVAVASPPHLTGGGKVGSAKVDWMTATWKPEPDEHVPATALALLSDVIGPVEGQSCAGMHRYAHGVRLFVRVRETACNIGRVDFGGDMLKGRARLDLGGAGCAVVKDWDAVTAWLGQQWEVSLTRVDLAVDCLFGQYTVEHAIDWYLRGEFRVDAQGAQPRHNLVGDWLDPHYGRTFEVGRRENGKMCRVYEKGRQLGDSASLWTRFEVEVRNNERVLPLGILTECDCYFAGAYRCLEQLVGVAGTRVELNEKEAEIALDRLTVHARSSYGQLIDVLRLRLTAAEVLDVLSRPGIPGRLTKSSLAEFKAAESPTAYLKESMQWHV
jgi:phage replication initiation protein